MSKPPVNRTGQRHGLVVVLGPWKGSIPVGARQPCWEVRCDCGTVRMMDSSAFYAPPPKTHLSCKRARVAAKGLPTE